MKYFFDIVICSLMVVLIHSMYTLGDKFLESRPDSTDGATQTAFYKCGKNKKTEVYCPIVIKGG